MHRAFIQKKVEAALDEARERIEALAAEFREQRLIPFCRRHRLTFLAGMGRTVFYRDGRPMYVEQLTALAPIEEILNIEGIGHNDCFGFYIAEITEDDIAGKRPAKKA